VSILERVIKLELPQEDSDAPDPSTSSSFSSKPLPPKPSDVSTDSALELSPEIYDEENIYESIST